MYGGGNTYSFNFTFSWVEDGEMINSLQRVVVENTVQQNGRKRVFFSDFITVELIKIY